MAQKAIKRYSSKPVMTYELHVVTILVPTLPTLKSDIHYAINWRLDTLYGRPIMPQKG